MSQEQAVQAFTFNPKSLDGMVLVTMTGSLSEDNNNKAKDEFLKILKDPPKKLVVDLSRIDYISSSGIALLVSILCRCRQMNCAMSICGLRTDTHELFRLTRLNQVFEIFENLAAAIKAARQDTGPKG